MQMYSAQAGIDLDEGSLRAGVHRWSFGFGALSLHQGLIWLGSMEMKWLFVSASLAVFALSDLGAPPSALADGKISFRLAQGTACEQVISCGTKNGVRKEYPTPCAAREDGATDIKPKTGPTCAAADK
jgi:hypothetical protein